MDREHAAIAAASALQGAFAGMAKSTAGSSGVKGRGGERQLKVRVKSARQRTASQTRWLERQLNDPYVAAARKDGWRSRAVFKLEQIQLTERLLRPVLDNLPSSGNAAQDISS